MYHLFIFYFNGYFQSGDYLYWFYIDAVYFFDSFRIIYHQNKKNEYIRFI